MHKLDTENMELAKALLNNSNLENLKILYLHGGSQTSLSGARDFLPDLLKIVRKQIFIDSFKLTEEDMQLIFDNSTKTINLCLVRYYF